MTIHPYHPLRRLAEGLHCVEGRLGRLPFERRMTVLGLPDGRTAIHSPIAMHEPDMAALERLGAPAAILVPNAFHTADAPWYAGRYPQARVLVPRGVRARLAGRTRIDGTLEDDWRGELMAALEREPLAGERAHEVVFCHRPSRTLVVADLVFNLGTDFHGLGKLFLRLNGAYGRFGPTRLFRRVFLRDRAALAASLAKVLAWELERIVMGHGAVVERNGRALLRESFGWLPL